MSSRISHYCLNHLVMAVFLLSVFSLPLWLVPSLHAQQSYPMLMSISPAAVQIGTQNFVDPFVWSKVQKGLEDYMIRHRIDRLIDLVGTFDPTPPKAVHA